MSIDDFAFDEPYDVGDFTAQDYASATATGRETYDDGQSAEQVIQNVLADVGNRSNIRGSTNYDPLFAQAFNMARGLQPGNRVIGDYAGSEKFRGIADLARPQSLMPQVVGEKGLYFSPVERYAQETLPTIIKAVRNVSPTGIITNLINRGLDVYNKGKEVIQETFEPEKETDVGIMQKMDRADLNDVGKAILAGMQNTNRNLPQVQTADLNLRELLTSPGVVGKALSATQPFIQNLLPEGVDFDAGMIFNQEKPEESYTGIKFTIPFSTG